MKFGFPFIICARLHQKENIFKAMEERYKNEENIELNNAIEQILLISTFRVKDIISMDSQRQGLMQKSEGAECKTIVLSSKL